MSRSRFSKSQLAQFAKQGWHIHQWATPYEVSLRRKSGLTARQFMALWVEENGSVWTNYVGEGGTLASIPLLFSGEPPWNPSLVKSAPHEAG